MSKKMRGSTCEEVQKLSSCVEHPEMSDSRYFRCEGTYEYISDCHELKKKKRKEKEKKKKKGRDCEVAFQPLLLTPNSHSLSLLSRCSLLPPLFLIPEASVTTKTS